MKLIRVQKDTQFEGLARPMTARAFIGSDSHSRLDRCRDKCWLSRFYYNLQARGDCQTQLKSYKRSHFVGWKIARICGKTHARLSIFAVPEHRRACSPYQPAFV